MGSGSGVANLVNRIVLEDPAPAPSVGLLVLIVVVAAVASERAANDLRAPTFARAARPRRGVVLAARQATLTVVLGSLGSSGGRPGRRARLSILRPRVQRPKTQSTGSSPLGDAIFQPTS